MDFVQWCGVLIAAFMVIVYFIVWVDYQCHKTIIDEHKCVASLRARTRACSLSLCPSDAPFVPGLARPGPLTADC